MNHEKEVFPDKNLHVDEVINADGLKFIEIRNSPFDVYGLYNYKNEADYKRLPDEIGLNVNEGVSTLYLHTAGGRVRFSTDSRYVAIRVSMPKVSHHSHMPLTGGAGLDLYIDESEGEEIGFFKTFVPPHNMTSGYESKIDLKAKKMRHFTINMPSYNRVDSLYIGIDGTLEGNNALVAIISMALGAIVGTLLDVDGRLNKLGDYIGSKTKNSDAGSVSQGFVTGSLLFCVGAMTIVGSLKSGLTGDHELILTKSVLDFFSSMMLSASLGIGVMFSGAFVFVFQGLLVLLARYIEPILTTAAIAEITCVGSLMIIGIGLNLIGVTKLKVSNYLPAIIFAPLATLLMEKLAAVLGLAL